MRQRRRPAAADESGLDPILDFMRLLWGIENRLQSASKRMEASLGITGPQRLVLRIVSRFPGLSACELAHLVRLHPSTVTGILQRLVRKGLLARETDPGDSRRVRLHVRPEAKPYTRRARGTVEATIARVLRRIPSRQVGHARLVLTAVAAALENEGR